MLAARDLCLRALLRFVPFGYCPLFLVHCRARGARDYRCSPVGRRGRVTVAGAAARSLTARR